MFSQTLRYIFKGGNQLWLCLPSVLVLLSLLFIPGAISFRTSDGILGSLQQWLIIALLWLPFLCKTIDNAAHIRAGKSAEPVPFGLSGELRLPELAQYLVGIAILTLPFAFSPTEFFAPVFFALLPAIHESFLESRTLVAMFSPAALLAAYARIGFARYRHILLSYLILFLALTGFGMLLAVPVTYVLFALVAGAAQGANVMPLLALTITIFTLGLYLNGLVWMFATLYPTMLCHGWRHPPIPDDDDAPPSAAWSSAATDADMETSVYDIDQSAQPAMATAPAAQNDIPLPAPAKGDTPPDCSLLADADTSDMNPETQKTFAAVLARADVLLGSNRIDAGLALLAPYADEAHDAAAYFPAYRRIYALAPQYALLQRLITAAACGHQPSFDFIRPELARINPADLPADEIYPLALYAARQRQHQTVLVLTRQFAKHHPNHPQLIDNYLLAARALAKTGHADKAQQMLTQMLARFGEHEKAGQIRATLKLLQS
ncbi:hypothetical protein [Cardiobacterium hominis]|uniref:tetratricopeptide repeat protein n=1 Tax=Cardiobacterium hominis TaxID=2718 RepID=UPI0028E75656|nr:hypothetical protein [Cardiobacterium hominis]